jgi:pimeloyl-ACP methyl ester carboxylesterase
LGWSWGGRITGRYVEQHADRIDRLVLLDPALGGNPVIPPAPTEPWWDNSYDYFIDRLEAEYSEQEARVALAKRMEAEEPKSPNGIRLEGSVLGSIPVEPTAVTRPTLMLYGSAAAKKNYMQGGMDRMEFFKRLATDNKQFTIIPDCGDYAHLQRPRQRLHKTIADFLMAE